MNGKFWENKRVLITGHTGFKGSWLSLWLQAKCANTIGYALPPPTEPSLFEVANVEKEMVSIIGDIRDLDKSFSELVVYYEKFLAAGDITCPGDLWWIIRPQPPLGTVEFRIFDIPTSVHRIGAFAALMQAAVDTYQDRFLAGKPVSEFHSGYLEENWWKAIRYGINTDMIEPETGEIISISEQLKRLIDLTAPKAKELHAEHHLDFAKTMIEQGNESEMQRVLCKGLNGDLRALEKELARKTLDFSV